MEDDEYLDKLMKEVEKPAGIGHNSQHYLDEKERLFVKLIRGRDEITAKTVAEAKEIIRKGKLERLDYDVNVMGKALSELRIDPETGERLSNDNYGKLVSVIFQKLTETKWFCFHYRADCIWAYENPDEYKKAREMFPNLTSIRMVREKYGSWQVSNGLYSKYKPLREMVKPESEDVVAKHYEERLKKHEEEKRKIFEDAVTEMMTSVKEGKASPEDAAKAAWEKSEAKRKEIEENPQVVDLLAHIKSTKNFKIDVVSANFVASMEQLIHKFPEEHIYSNISRSLSNDPINIKVPALHKMAGILNSLCEEYQIQTRNMQH